MTEKYFVREEAAGEIRQRGIPCTKGTLAKLASIGGGPVYRVFGKNALYTLADINEWIDRKISAPRASTSGGRSNES